MTAARCRFVTRVTVVTGRQELRVRVVCPDVCWLHSVISVLAVCNGIARKVSHPSHLPHTAARILDKPILRRKLPNNGENVRIHFIAELCVFADGIKISGFVILPPVVRYRRNAECSAVRRCPYMTGSHKEVSQKRRKDAAQQRNFKTYRDVRSCRLSPALSARICPCTAKYS